MYLRYPRYRYPCLLTIDKDTCVPRLPSYLLKKATADRPIRILSFENMPDQDLSRYGLVGSPTSVERMFAPPEGEKQVYLEGGAERKSRGTFFYFNRKEDHIGGTDTYGIYEI